MNYAAYTGLLADLCNAAGLADAARLVDEGRLEVAGHTVSFSYDEAIDPKHASVVIDLGEVPEHEREQVYRTALETNAQAKSPRDGVVGIDAESSHLSYRFFVPLDGSYGASAVLDTITGLLAEDEEVSADAEAAREPLLPAGLRAHV